MQPVGVERLIVAVVLAILAVSVAAMINRRKPAAPTQPKSAPLPSQLDRDDFESRSTPLLMVLFSSSKCDSCAKARLAAQALVSEEVAYQEAPYESRRDLHTRYSIQAVPSLLLVDANGVVKAGFVGAPAPDELKEVVGNLARY